MSYLIYVIKHKYVLGKQRLRYRGTCGRLKGEMLNSYWPFTDGT